MRWPPAGQVTAAVLMIAGLAFLGAVAGSLASFLGLGNEEEGPTDNSAVLREVRELRDQISRLEGGNGDDRLAAFLRRGGRGSTGRSQPGAERGRAPCDLRHRTTEIGTLSRCRRGGEPGAEGTDGRTESTDLCPQGVVG